jgi:hypothetical protein
LIKLEKYPMFRIKKEVLLKKSDEELDKNTGKDMN